MNKLSHLSKIMTKRKKIVGRGYGSGKGGHCSGRGMNGQNSRAGANLRPTFEGGQNELIHRLPVLRGRKRAKRTEEVVRLYLSHLNKFKDGDVVSYESLITKKLILKGQKVKILNRGKLDKKITIDNIKMSVAAKANIEKVK